ncbi:hypothetical protein LXG23DRAFT_39056 [Yarrowia lipolytica]|nr:hypothetical protein LXG23DRAFT_39056 [Yarrowia lipolytica]
MSSMHVFFVPSPATVPIMHVLRDLSWKRILMAGSPWLNLPSNLGQSNVCFSLSQSWVAISEISWGNRKMSLSVCLYNTGPGQGGTCISDKFSSNRSQFKSGSQTRGFYDEYLSGMLAATRCRVLRSNVQQKRNLNGPADGPAKRTISIYSIPFPFHSLHNLVFNCGEQLYDDPHSVRPTSPQIFGPAPRVAASTSVTAYNERFEALSVDN